MQRVSSWLIALLAVLVFAAAGYVIVKKDPVKDAGAMLPVQTPVATAASTSLAGSGSSSNPEGGGSTTGTASGGRVIAFLGDDWTVGEGSTGKSKRFTSLLADALGGTEKNFGADDTGYAKVDGNDGPYGERIGSIVKANPDVVVVTGGRNDVSDYVPTLRSSVKALFAELHDRLPNATIIAVAPMWGDSDKPDDLKPVTAAVKQYATAYGGTYLDIPDPIHGHPGDMASSSDPNDKGYAAIAAALGPKIRALLDA